MVLLSNLPTFIFSSQFPVLRFERCEYTTINFCVYCASQKVLDINLTSIATDDQDTDDVIELYDIGRLFEQNMRQRGLSAAYLEIYCTDLVVEDCTVIYCPYQTAMDAVAFVTGHFLTTLRAKRIPADATEERLEFVRLDSEYNQVLTLNIKATYKDSDGFTHFNEAMTRSLQGSIRHTMDISPATVLGMLEDKGTDAALVLSYEVSIGGRSFLYFVDNVSADMKGFLFRNAFNTEERAYFEAMTARDTNTERSLATMHGTSMFYDQQDNEDFEVTTAPLSFAEAEWLKQMVLSHQVMLPSGDEILITDSEVKVSDNDTELKRIKFTYRLARTGASIDMGSKATAVAHARIFTNDFALEFS